MTTNQQPVIMIVEDDARLAELVARYLVSSAFKVIIANLTEDVSDQVFQHVPDVVILDLGLPREDGFSICRKLRPRFGKHILILTAQENDADHIIGLELGADDYVVKPVDPRVLVARIQALLRRRQGVVPQLQNWKMGGLSVDAATRTVMLNNQIVNLTSHEFDLLLQLVMRAGQIQSREFLYRELYKRDYDGIDRLLDVRISHLRKKLEDDKGPCPRIKTIWGQGYLLVPIES